MQWKQETMFSCIISLVTLMDFLSHFDPLFNYIPEYYLETLIDSFHALRRGDPPLAMADPSRVKGLMKVISFLINHFDDKRVINPGWSMCDVILIPRHSRFVAAVLVRAASVSRFCARV